MDSELKQHYLSGSYPTPDSSATVDGELSHSSSRLYDTPGSSPTFRYPYDSSGSFSNSAAFTISYQGNISTSPSSGGMDSITQDPTASFPGTPTIPTYGTSSDIRQTPSSLGWTHNTELLKLYNFKVPKDTEPYFELLPQWIPTYETPAKVYLDQSLYVVCLTPISCRED
jgi:hypothetical protein